MATADSYGGVDCSRYSHAAACSIITTDMLWHATSIRGTDISAAGSDNHQASWVLWSGALHRQPAWLLADGGSLVLVQAGCKALDTSQG